MNKLGKETIADLASRRLWCLKSEALCARARSGTSLKDFGNPEVERLLSILVTSLESEGKLHPLGRFLMRHHLLGILKTRLRLAQAWRGQEDNLAALSIGSAGFHHRYAAQRLHLFA